jgi:hypothetical protein
MAIFKRIKPASVLSHAGWRVFRAAVGANQGVPLRALLFLSLGDRTPALRHSLAAKRRALSEKRVETLACRFLAPVRARART